MSLVQGHVTDGLWPGFHDLQLSQKIGTVLSFSMYFQCTDNTEMALWLPHTSRFFVVELQIFCQGQIGLKLIFVRPSACRTLADFLWRLTALRLGAESSKIKMAPCWKRRLFT